MSRRPGDAWTGERKDEVRRLWIEGRSATQIANVLGAGATRMMVLGVIHRNKAAWGIVNRGPSVAMPRTPREPRPASPPKPKAVRHGNALPQRRPAAAPIGPLPTVGTVPFLDARRDQWRFPFWDRFDLATSLYCGRPIAGETPYCAEHRALCIQPLSNSRIAKQTREVEAA